MVSNIVWMLYFAILLVAVLVYLVQKIKVLHRKMEKLEEKYSNASTKFIISK